MECPVTQTQGPLGGAHPLAVAAATPRSAGGQDPGRHRPGPLRPAAWAARACAAGLALSLGWAVPASAQSGAGAAGSQGTPVVPGADTPPVPPPATTDPDAAQKVIVSAPPPQPSALTGPLLRALLMAELMRQEGQTADAVELMLSAARHAEDDQLFQRAVQIAAEAGAGEKVLQITKQWRQSLPRSVEAVRTQVQFLFALDRVADTAEPLKALLALSPANERAQLIAGLPRAAQRAKDKAGAAAQFQALLGPYLDAPATRTVARVALGRMRLAEGRLGAALELARSAQAGDPGALGPALLALDLMNLAGEGGARLDRGAADGGASTAAAAGTGAGAGAGTGAGAGAGAGTGTGTGTSAKPAAANHPPPRPAAATPPAAPNASASAKAPPPRSSMAPATGSAPATPVDGAQLARVSEALVRTYLGTPKAEPVVRQALASVLTTQQRVAEAATELRAAALARPGMAGLWLSLGELEIEQRHPEAAEQALRMALDLATSPPPAATPADMADSASAETDIDGHPGDEGPDADPLNGGVRISRVYLLLARAAQLRGDTAGANQWLSHITPQDSDLPVLAARAAMLARQGRLDEARALLRSASADTPGGLRLRTLAEVQLLREQKQPAEAREVLVQARQQMPEDIDLMYEQAMIDETLERLDEMEQLLRRVIALQPEHAQALNALGYSLADRRVRLDEAHALVLRAHELAPADPFIVDSLGWVEFRRGNLAAAARWLRQAYAARNDTEIAAHLGEALWAQGERDEALRIWREASERDAGNAVLRETLTRLKAGI